MVVRKVCGNLYDDLERFVMNNDDLEKLEDSLSEFNIFEAIGAVRSELRHSDFLAFLLSPNKEHGLGDYFLKSLLMEGVSNFSSDLNAAHIDIMDMHDAEVKRVE